MADYNINHGNVRLSTHFMLHEFQSKNGYHIVKVSDDLINALENIFEHFKCTKAIVIDGYRQEGAYCQSIGGMTYDAHAAGIAVDITFYDANGIISNKLIACYAQDIGLGGIGYMGNTIHLDVRHLGGYKNTHWWGDETNGFTVNDWYAYWGFTRNNTNVIVTNETINNNLQAAYDYVNCDYIYYLGRIADIDGLTSYSHQLISGEMTEAQVDASIASSDEAKEYDKRRYIKECYRVLLNRDAAENEIDTCYKTTSTSATPLRDIYKGIRYSAEYLGKL